MIYSILVVEGRGAKSFHEHYHVGRKKIQDSLGLAVQFCALLSRTKEIHGPHSKLFDAPVSFQNNAAIMAMWVSDEELWDITEDLKSHFAEYEIYYINPQMIQHCCFHHWGYQREAYNERYAQALERIG